MKKVEAHSECSELRDNLIKALRQLRKGDFSVRLGDSKDPKDREIASLFNDVVSLNERIAGEFERLSKVVGKEGRIGHRAKVHGATGGWEANVRAVNELSPITTRPSSTTPTCAVAHESPGDSTVAR